MGCVLLLVFWLTWHSRLQLSVAGRGLHGRLQVRRLLLVRPLLLRLLLGGHQLLARL